MNYKVINIALVVVSVFILIALFAQAVIAVGTTWYLKVSHKLSEPIKTSEYPKELDDKTASIDQNATTTTASEHAEIELLKKEITALKRQQATATQNKVKVSTPIPSLTPKSDPEQSNSDTITASEISQYISGVVQLDCGFVKGSGSLWKSNRVITNAHVVEEPDTDGSCRVFAENAKGNLEGIYKVYPYKSIVPENLDAAFLSIEPSEWSLTNAIPIKPINELNYSISSLRSCNLSTPVGAPVVVIGYPASGSMRVDAPNGKTATFSGRITTNGIISGYAPKINSEYANYFVSAKIDSGNSGGIALSKDKNGLCVLGIPTWLNVGNYDTQGMIQNIHNIMTQM